ncbi:acetyl-CoA hydrolase [Schizosaccharomyces japonicus yFS275]|uniref:Acetyl-CoA hydrolase n=1 Tax=Schizosaccharomyces japonicus (strain yFS275 / FY16936) TaxID=402676 RepID=B6K306_SCHJY|nr:acetyl-CoA hydrolase [Schizosaccharomyces japonicus yFS275]EEB07863.1 acetyl-CoA hydrolase [Schizosaccharomyces japonicus yFS275]
MTTQLLSRIACKSLLPKVVAQPEQLLPTLLKSKSIGWSGFTGVTYPIRALQPLLDYAEQNRLPQVDHKYDLFVCASGGTITESKMAELGLISSRVPYQVSKSVSKKINSGEIAFTDTHLGMFPQEMQYNHYRRMNNGRIDTVVVEASAIKEDGSIVPGASICVTPELVQLADKVIIEVNTQIPSFEGFHDVVTLPLPPHRTPLRVSSPSDRIGQTSIPCPLSKVAGIIEGSSGLFISANAKGDAATKAIAGWIVEFLEHEVQMGRLPEALLPLQSGIGKIANSVIEGLDQSNFKNVSVWTEVLQDGFLPLFDSNKISVASSTSIRLSTEGFEHFFNNWDFYKSRIILRQQSITNSPEIIRRLGCISLNTPLELDIYGHANSTCVNGSRMLNGLGGSGDFLRNAKLSIMHTMSTRPTKSDPLGISCIVPRVTHVDHTEHDMDIFVTEQGLADLRGLSPKERSIEIIRKCAHPAYQPILFDYFQQAEQKCLKRGCAHEPHMLDKIFKMHEHLETDGTMRIQKW